MMDAVNSWVLELTGAALISAAAVTLTPDGAAKGAVRLVCGLISVAALISIGGDVELDSCSFELSEYRADAERLAESASEEAEKMKRAIIEEQTAAYILDKAEETGISGMTAEVGTVWNASDGCWQPDTVRITAGAEVWQQNELERYIETELGIPADKQEWSGYE